jgi:N utilization substance protein B
VAGITETAAPKWRSPRCGWATCAARRVSDLIVSARRHAREVVFRVAFQADATADPYSNTWSQRAEMENLSADQAALVADVVQALEGRLAEIDGAIREAAEHWPLERLSGTDRAVLRAAVAEMIACAGTPARVILDEAIEIARRFGSEESGRFVNGVLDRVARRLRPAEFA